ncbi:MAG: hypothetical protein ACTSX6_10020 [Candidatus Heimdallarchaeaceae archaeon]
MSVEVTKKGFSYHSLTQERDKRSEYSQYCERCGKKTKRTLFNHIICRRCKIILLSEYFQAVAAKEVFVTFADFVEQKIEQKVLSKLFSLNEGES